MKILTIILCFSTSVAFSGTSSGNGPVRGDYYLCSNYYIGPVEISNDEELDASGFYCEYAKNFEQLQLHYQACNCQLMTSAVDGEGHL